MARLPERFSLEDVSRNVAGDELRDALSWLYDAIERGRVVPHQEAEGLRYSFTGRRRAKDKGDPERSGAVA